MVRISIKINLEINKDTRDKELEKKIPNLKPLTRIFCKIKFLGLQTPEDAIVDTGAHISVIPFYIWKKLSIDSLAEHTMKGIVPLKLCEVPVIVGKVKAMLIDEYGNISSEIEFLSYLAYSNKVPVVMGFRDLLEHFKVHIDIKNNEAYLEEENH